MKRNVFIFLLTAVLAVFVLISCQPNRKAVDIHNSRLTLDWTGVYTGTIPSASGSGIDVRIKLNFDDTYELTYKYIGKAENTFNFSGTFKWGETEEFITIGIPNAPTYYKVAENKLIQLDTKGKFITGKLADSYVLWKE